MKEKTTKKTEEKKTEKHAGGRPPKYDSKYCKKLIDFFNIEPYKEREINIITKDGREITRYEDVANDLPTFERFAVSIGTHRNTLLNWCEQHTEFLCAYNKAKDCQKDMLIVNGLRGLYQPAAFIFTSKNVTDMRDKQVVEHEGLGAFVSKFNSPEDKI